MRGSRSRSAKRALRVSDPYCEVCEWKSICLSMPASRIFSNA